MLPAAAPGQELAPSPLQARRAASLPPVCVSCASSESSRLGSCEQINSESDSPEASSSKGSALVARNSSPLVQVPLGSARLPLPPLSPLYRPPTEDSATSAASLRHGQIINDIEGVLQQQDERQRQVEERHRDAIAQQLAEQAELAHKAAQVQNVEKASHRTRKAAKAEARASKVVGDAKMDSSIMNEPVQSTTTSLDDSSSGEAAKPASPGRNAPNAVNTAGGGIGRLLRRPGSRVHSRETPPAASSEPKPSDGGSTTADQLRIADRVPQPLLPIAPCVADAPTRPITSGEGSTRGTDDMSLAVRQSVQILEACKWRIILEHGPLGETVAIAAFAPGPNGDCSSPVTPNTPVTPNFGYGQQQQQQQIGSGCQENYGGCYGRSAGSSTWTRSAEVEVPFQQRTLRSAGYRGHASNRSSAPRMAWDADAIGVLALPPPRRTALPLRRAAPAPLWGLLHLFGLRELELHTACRPCDVVALVASALIMAGLASQLGMVTIHWASVLPLDIAIALFVGTFGGWLNMMILLQAGYIPRLFGSSAGDVYTSSREVERASTHNAGRMMANDFSGAGGIREGPETDQRVLTEPPVAMSKHFLLTVRARVRRCVIGVVLTSAGLYSFEWYWLDVLRLLPILPARNGLTLDVDGVLWMLSVREQQALETMQLVVWGTMSLVSTILAAGALWVPLCCCATLLDAHAYLAGQLHEAVKLDAIGDSSEAAELVLMMIPRHVQLAQETSGRLAVYSSVHVFAFGYVVVSGPFHLALDGASTALIVAISAALLATFLLLQCFGTANATFQDQMLMTTSGLLRRHTSTDSIDKGLAAHATVMSELRTSRARLASCGVVDCSPKEAVVLLLSGAGVLAVAIMAAIHAEP